MNTNLKVVLFIFVVVGFYVGFASSIPQIESRPPAETKLNADMSPEALAQAGQQIVTGDKGGCLTCHGLGQPGPRAPDLQGVGARAATRVAGQTVEGYLRNAILNPCAYLVEGYDCLMAGMGLDRRLSPAEQKAVIAFLQSLGGQITVRLTAVDLAAPSGRGASGGPEFIGATGPDLFTEAGCVACHTLQAVGAAGQVGPDLSGLGARLTPDTIRLSILDPNAFIAENCPTGPCISPSLMPPNFGERFTARQLETLVNFLASLGGPTSGTPAVAQARTPPLAVTVAISSPTTVSQPTQAPSTAPVDRSTTVLAADAPSARAETRPSLSPTPSFYLFIGVVVAVPTLTILLGTGLAFAMMTFSRLKAQGYK